MRRARQVVLIVALGSVGAAGFAAGHITQEPPTAVAFEDARFVPINPDRPDGPRIAVLNGDPATGPSDMLMAFGKGGGVRHTHSADYRLVVVRGTMKHWESGAAEQAKPMGPGSYWFQKGGGPHSDLCLSDECVMFISWSGKRDAAVAPE